MAMSILILIVYVFHFIKCITGQNTWSTAVANYETLYNFYDNSGTSLTDIIPLNDQTRAMEVRVGLALDSLNGYDAVKGQIDISGSISLEWTDEASQLMATTDRFKYFTDDIIVIDYDKAWTPSLVLLNAVDTVKNVGDTTYKLRFSMSNGTVTWRPRVLLRASCRPDVTYYPFDRQNCSFTYTAWGYTSNEIDLRVTRDEWDTSSYEPNGVWDIISTSSSVYRSSGSTYAKFSIIIERQPLYFTFNIALPILLLGLLNGFVFLLPAESGERVGFCITCFLSFVILLQTTMDYLPEIASPMSLLCFYIIVMMIFSMVINILTILMLRVYHKPPKEKVPGWLQKFVRVVSCMVCKRHKDSDAPPEEIDWPSVGRLLDFFFFIAFLGVQSGFTVLFLIPVATGA